MKNAFLFHTDEAHALAQQVLSLSPLWIPRGRDLNTPSYYTLGATLYLDTSYDVSRRVLTYEKYANLIQKTNSLLKENFPAIYSQLTTFFERELNASILFHPDYALPGFHIYHRAAQNGGMIHNDLSTKLFALEKKHPLSLERENLLSFTLLVQKPLQGASLKVWDQKHRLLQPIDTENLGPPQSQVFYKTGHLYFFDSYLIHQQGPMLIDEDNPSDYRITLQGHLLKTKENKWILHW